MRDRGGSHLPQGLPVFERRRATLARSSQVTDARPQGATRRTRTTAHKTKLWSKIEVFFRDAKQWLGFADSPARTESAVLRMAPFVGLLYSVLVLWFAAGAYQSSLAAPPVRPWYRHKKGMSFADIFGEVAHSNGCLSAKGESDGG
jgi:hypothetical protein